MGKGHPRSFVGSVRARAPQTRRTFLAVAVAACASACSHSRLFELTDGTAWNPFSPEASRHPLTRRQVEKIPDALIAVKFGRLPPDLLTLGRFDKPDLNWMSSDGVALVTRRGRLMRTAGLKSNLTATGFYDPDPVAQGSLHTVANGYRLRRRVDMQPGNRMGIRVDSTFDVAGPERIEIVELSFETVRIVETSKAGEIDWSFTNTYWADRKTGFVWKSVQHYVPERPPLEVEVLKAAA